MRIKSRIYGMMLACPVRDKILVENTIHHNQSPVGTLYANETLRPYGTFTEEVQAFSTNILSLMGQNQPLIRLNFILFALFLFFSSGELWSQEQMPYRPAATFNGDTLRYLEYNYSIRRPQYIGKTVRTVLKELEYPIIYVAGRYGGDDKLTGLTLGIRQVGEEPSIELRDYYIFIRFANPPDIGMYNEVSGRNIFNNPYPTFSEKLHDFIKNLEISGIWSNENIAKDPELVEGRRRAMEKLNEEGRKATEEYESRNKNLE